MGTLMLIVVDSESGIMLEGAYAEWHDLSGLGWNETTTGEQIIIPFYGGKYRITVSLDNYTDNSTIFNITHENLTRLVLEMVRIAEPTEDDDDIPGDDDDDSDDDDDKSNGENVKADTATSIPSWFIIFVLALLIPLLLLLVIFLKRRKRHKSRVKVIRYVGPPAMLPPPPPQPLLPATMQPATMQQATMQQATMPPATIPPAVPNVYVPGDTALQAGTAMAPAAMYPYGRLLERPALPMYTGDGTASHEMTDPNAPSDTFVQGPFAEGSLDEIFQFQNVPSGEVSSTGTGLQMTTPPPPRIIPPGEKKGMDGVVDVTLDPKLPTDPKAETGTGAIAGPVPDEGVLGKEEVISKLKSLIETINKKDDSGQADEPPAGERSFSDITVTLPPDDVSENKTKTTSEPVNPPPPVDL